MLKNFEYLTVLNNKGKVLYIKPSRRKFVRRMQHSWNYYQTLFLISLSFNLLFIGLFCLKNN
jgi:hypothetical protein